MDIGSPPSPDGVQDIGGSVNGRIQMEDKKQPGRLSSELAYAKLDPMGQGNYRVDQPRAWLYMRDGRIVHVRADGGQIKRSGTTATALGGQAEIESGRFFGNVLIRVFPPRPSGTGLNVPVDPDREEPGVLMAMDSVDFDAVLLRASTTDTFTVSTRNLLMEGDGLLVGVNQVRSRIELLQTTGRFVRYNPNIRTDRRAGTHARASAEASPSSPANQTSGPASVGNAQATGADSPPASEVRASAEVAQSASSPKVDQYQTTIVGDLTVTQAGRVLTADTLDVFLRLIDNALPENAFGVWPSRTPSSAEPASASADAPSTIPEAPSATTAQSDAHGASTAGAVPGNASASSPAATPPLSERPSVFVSAGDEDIVMRWTGPLVMRPIEGPTPELEDGNHFAARFDADRPGGRERVQLTDKETRANITCAQIEYAATKRMLALIASGSSGSGSSDAGSRVIARVPDAGQIIAAGVRIDVGTGLGHAAGGGSLMSLREQRAAFAFVGPPAPPELSVDPAALIRQITWTDQMDFQFRLRNGRISGALDWAQFNGNVLAKDKLSTIGGDFLKAEFMPVGTQESALKRVRVVGNASAIAGPRVVEASRAGPVRDPMVAAREIVVQFQPSRIDANESDPVRAVATGGVRAATPEATLTTASLEAVMTRDPAEGVVVTDVLCDGQTAFDRIDGVSARADRVRANPLLRTVDLTGQPVALSRDGSTILGTQMSLDDAAGTLLVFGEGAMEHVQSPKSGLADDQTHVRATWTKSMLFNNARGTVECAGDTTVMAASALRQQTIKAERLNLWLTPAGEQTPLGGRSGGSGLAAGERALLKAEAVGAAVERDGAANATVEMRRYARPISTIASADDANRPITIGDRVLEQVLYMEGPRILADDVAGTVEIPGAGRAIVRDQKQSGSSTSRENQPDTSPIAAGGSRGTSRLTWAERMTLDRNSGLLRMTKDTELVHLPLGGTQATRIVASQMDAYLNLRGDGLEARSAELQRAEAVGAVFAESGTQKLLCDRLVYDAVSGVASASSNDGSRVTLYDERKPTPMVARSLRWDLLRDRVEVTEPSPIASPR